MHQLNPLLQQTIDRKSIHALQFNKYHPSGFQKNFNHEKINEPDKLYNLNNIIETKKSIIKINRKKLPLDFIMDQKVEPVEYKPFSKKEKPYQRCDLKIEKSQLKQTNKNFDNHDEGYKMIDLPLTNNQKINEQNYKNLDYDKNVADNKSDSRQNKKKQVYQSFEKQMIKRNYQTRSQQKRDKLELEQRNTTAVNKSQKLDIFDILPFYQQKILNQLNDIIIFTGAFNKQMKNISARTALLTPIIQKPEKAKLRDENIKVTIKKRNNHQNYSSQHKNVKQFISPSKPSKESEQINTRSKIYNKSKVEKNELQSKNASITFYNSKSSNFPPINQNNK